MASSSLVEKDRITVLVKGVGAWTKGLQKLAHNHEMQEQSGSSAASTKCPFATKGAAIHVEGPYGHQHPYFLEYVF